MSMASYIINVQVVFTVLFIVYYFLFRKEKFLALNRFVLIGMLLAAFVLPLSPALNINDLAISPLNKQAKGDIAYPQFLLSNHSPKILVKMSEPLWKVNYEKVTISAYLMVSSALFVFFLINLYKVYSVITASRRRKVNGLTFCEPSHESAPFSFFNFIVVSKRSFNPEEYRQIIAHENAHARQLHSFDVLFADMACLILWINPLIYLYRMQLKLNLEFLADNVALSSGIDAQDYQLNLLRHSGILTAFPPVNPFFNSKIKERIITINTEQPQIRNIYKYILLPVLLLTLSALVGFRKIGRDLKPQPPIFFKKANQVTNGHRASTEPVSIGSNDPDRPLPNNSIGPPHKPTQPKYPTSSVFIDARTDTVKFSLVRDSVNRRFKGIYVIENKILTDDEIRAAIKSDGGFEVKLTSRPIIGTYSANDSSAVKKWGEDARYGVVFVKSRPEKPN